MVDPGEEDPEIWTYALDGDPAEPQLVGHRRQRQRRLGLDWAVVPGTGPTPPPPAAGGFDGDPATTERVAAADPTQAAVLTSQARFPAGRVASRRASRGPRRAVARR